jgi:hypothetical protein
MPEFDPLEAEFLAGAASALRRRADRQARISADGTTFGDRGVSVRTGEAAIADRLSAVLSALAAEFERVANGSHDVIDLETREARHV